MVETYFWKGFEMLRQSKSSKSSISPSRDGRQIFLHCLNGALFGFQRVVDLPFNPSANFQKDPLYQVRFRRVGRLLNSSHASPMEHLYMISPGAIPYHHLDAFGLSSPKGLGNGFTLFHPTPGQGVASYL